MSNKKIAVIGLKGLPAFGGAATVGENIIEQLKDKYDFTVYSVSSHTDLESGEYNGYKQIVLREIPFPKLNSLWYYIGSAIHALMTGSYDLVHLHHRDAAFIAPLLKLRYRVLLTTHQFDQLVEKWKRFHFYFEIQERYFTRFADEISCVSLNDKKRIKQKINVNAKYIPNGINPLQNIEYLKVPNQDYLFFAAGRIIPSKGLHVLLKALREIDSAQKVFVAGDLDQIRTYKKALTDLAQGLNISFLGLIKDKEKLFNYLSAASLFVFPSEMEGMSMMLLEAASVKVPIICSDIEANTDIFTEREVLFFRKGSVTDLAEKIDWAESHKNEMQLRAERAQNKLMKQYTWDKIADQYSDLYSSLME